MAVEQPGPGPADGTSGVIVNPISHYTSRRGRDRAHRDGT